MNNSESKIVFIIKNTDSSDQSDIKENIIHNKNSRKNRIKLSSEEYQEKLIVWSLRRYISKIEYQGIEWQYISSGKKLNNGIFYEEILLVINSENIFENFSPKENDLLTIRLEYKHPEKHRKSRPYINDFISFVYEQEWRLNKDFEHIHNSYEIIAEGKIIIG